MFFQLLELFLGRLRRNVVVESSGPLGMSRRGGYFHRIERINASSVSMVSTARNRSMSVVHGQHSTDGRGIVLTMTVGTVRTVRCIRRLGLTRNRWDRWNRHGCHDMGRVGDVDCRMRVARTATSMTGMAVRVGSPGVAGRRCSNRSGSGMGRLGGIHRLEAVELVADESTQYVHRIVRHPLHLAEDAVRRVDDVRRPVVMRRRRGRGPARQIGQKDAQKNDDTVPDDGTRAAQTLEEAGLVGIAGIGIAIVRMECVRISIAIAMIRSHHCSTVVVVLLPSLEVAVSVAEYGGAAPPPPLLYIL